VPETRIRVVYTGGTIGMVDSPRGLVPGADLTGWLGSLLVRSELAGMVEVAEFDHLIDSSNATPLDWQAVVDDVRRHSEQADGFVVLHGTDTMAYTAAALAFALTGLDRPVVVTGAQDPLGVVGSDAYPNVTGALRAVASGRMRGVGLYFGHRLLAGARSTKTSSWAFRGFDSPNQAALAQAGEPWSWNAPPPPGRGWPNPKPYVRQDVVVVNLAPGITAKRLAALLDPLPDAVILRAYGVGNAPSEEPGLTDVLAATVAAGVPVVVSSQCQQANVLLGHYEAGDALARLGAIGSVDMTLEATYTKVVFLLSQGVAGQDLAAWMGRSIAGELTEPT
jgi:L-asparaginase